MDVKVSFRTVSARMRRDLYADAVSSKRAPVSASEPTVLEVRSATAETDMGPARRVEALVDRRARSWSSSQSSRKKTSSLQSRIFFSRYSALP